MAARQTENVSASRVDAVICLSWGQISIFSFP